MTLTSQPATPHLKSPIDERYAQYNEVRVAAASYQLMEWLGKNPPPVAGQDPLDLGLKRLLGAMAHYKRDGHGVWVTRDLRDSAVQEFEQTAQDHAAIEDIFAGQQISWDQGLAVMIGPDTEINHHDQRIALHITGPDGFDCRSGANTGSNVVLIDGGRGALGRKGASGGLPFSANDDCYIVYEPGVLGTSRWEIPFPYLANLAHWEKMGFTVRAKYFCGPNDQFFPHDHCPHMLKMIVSVLNTSVIVAGPQKCYGIPVTLVRDAEVPLQTFTADGNSKVGDANTDCGF